MQLNTTEASLFNIFIVVKCKALDPSFVHWISLITKAATVFYYNRRGSVTEHTSI
jgi:hypothetical protein